jgi:hypothetical protein
MQCWMTIASLLMLVIMPAVCAAQAPVAQPAVGQTPPIDPYLVIERFPVPWSDGAIMLPVEIGGRTRRFMLHTGASVSVIDKSLVADAKPVSKGFNEGTRERIDMFAMPAATLGKIDLKADIPKVAAFDLTRLSETCGYEVAGLLGYDFIGARIVQIDFDREELLILNKLPENCGEKITVAFKEPSRPSIKVKIAESRVEDFYLDTGACGFDSGCLRPKLRETLLAGAKCRVVSQVSNPTADGTSTVRVLQAKQISAGDLVTPQPVFGEKGHNLLSLNYLSRYCVTFDLGHSRIYLKEGKRFRQPDQIDRSGLHLIRRDAQAMIQTVDAGSAGAVAGLLAGDRLLFVGDIRGDNGSLHQIRGVLCAADATVPILIRRADREYKVSLRLAPAVLELPK